MKKYELYTLTDMKNNKWNVMEVKESMTEEEIDEICRLNGIDEVRFENNEVV